MNLTINLIENQNTFIANCQELDINCYGNSKNEVIDRIQNVLQFYLDSAKDLGLSVEKIDFLKINGEDFYFNNYTKFINCPETVH